MPKLFKKLHLIEVNKKYLIDRIHDEPLVQRSQKCMKYVREALKFHLSLDASNVHHSRFKLRPARLVDVVVCFGEYEEDCMYGYVIEEKRWISLKFPSLGLMCYYAAVGLGNRLIYISKRKSSDDKNMYDPLTNSWVQFPGTRHEYMYEEDSVVVCGGRIYAFGGRHVEMFDPDSDCWTEKPSIPRKPGNILHTVATKHGLHVYVICYERSSGLLKVWRLETERDVWSSALEHHIGKRVTPSSYCIHPCITTETEDGTEVLLGSIKVVIPNDSNHEVCVKDATLPRIPVPRTRAGVCNINGNIFVCGGLLMPYMLETDTVCLFDSSTQTWKDLPRMPEEAEIAGCALLQLPYEYTTDM